MANDNKTTIVFDGDVTQLQADLNKAFNSAKKKASESVGDGLKPSKKSESDLIKSGTEIGNAFGEALSGGFNPSRILGMLGPIGALSAAIGVAGAAMANFAFEGEKLIKIQKNFDAVADSFGVAGEKLQNAFIGATGGIVDDDDALQLLSEKLVQFNGQVGDLPALMELSRKAANLFGKDTLQVFDGISNAIATGNFKQLKFLIPKLDADKVLSDYANTLNKLKSELTEAEKIQALTNAVMLEGGDRLKGVALEAGTASEAWERLKISIGNAFESLQTGTAKSTGGFFKSFFDTARLAVEGNLLQEKKGNDLLQDAIVKRFDLIAQKQDLVKDKENAWFGVRKTSLQNQINQTDALIKKQDEIIRQQEESIQKTAEAKKASAVKTDEKVDAVVPGMSAGKLAAFSKFQDELNQKLMSSKLSMLQTEFNHNKNVENLDKIHDQQLLSNKQQGITERMNLFNQLKQSELISEQNAAEYSKQIAMGKMTGDKLIDDLVLKQLEDQKNKKLAIDASYIEQKKILEDQARKDELANQMSFQDGFMNATSAFGQMMIMQAEDIRKNYTKTMEQIANTAMQGLGNGVSNGIKKMTIAFREGKNGLQAFGEAFLATIGDMMVQMGTSFISMAIPMLILNDPRGGPLLGAGAGLIAAGTLLSASVGGGSTQDLGTANNSSGGGVYGGSTGINSTNNQAITAPEDKAIVEPKASVNLTVQGNILNNRESALYLAEVLEDGFRDQAIQFRGV